MASLGVGSSCGLAVACVCAAAAAFAYEPSLTPQAISDAIRIGQSRQDAARMRFHQGYRVRIARPPVDYVDVVTPFRRVEIAAEERTRTGDLIFTQREALDVVAAAGPRLDVFVEFTFHPLNTYVGVPPYVITLAVPEAAARIEPVNVDRVPRFGVRPGGAPGSPYPVPSVPGERQAMLGGTVIAGFAAGAIDPRGMYDVVVEENGKELARARVNLASLR